MIYFLLLILVIAYILPLLQELDTTHISMKDLVTIPKILYDSELNSDQTVSKSNNSTTNNSASTSLDNNTSSNNSKSKTPTNNRFEENLNQILKKTKENKKLTQEIDKSLDYLKQLGYEPYNWHQGTEYSLDPMNLKPNNPTSFMEYQEQPSYYYRPKNPKVGSFINGCQRDWQACQINE